jgi:hypothetical protein
VKVTKSIILTALLALVPGLALASDPIGSLVCQPNGFGQLICNGGGPQMPNFPQQMYEAGAAQANADALEAQADLANIQAAALRQQMRMQQQQAEQAGRAEQEAQSEAARANWRAAVCPTIKIDDPSIRFCGPKDQQAALRRAVAEDSARDDARDAAEAAAATASCKAANPDSLICAPERIK